MNALRLPIVDDEATIVRPRTRGQCADVPRPCPFVTCRWSTFVDLEAAGVVREPDEIEPAFSCVLDVCERDGASLEDAGRAIGASASAVHGITIHALAKLIRHPLSRSVLEQLAGEGAAGGAAIRSREDHVALGDAPQRGARDEVAEEADDQNDDERARDAIGGRVLDDEDDAIACGSVWRMLERRRGNARSGGR